jgi:hypothetical protein
LENDILSFEATVLPLKTTMFLKETSQPPFCDSEIPFVFSLSIGVKPPLQPRERWFVEGRRIP